MTRLGSRSSCCACLHNAVTDLASIGGAGCLIAACRGLPCLPSLLPVRLPTCLPAFVDSVDGNFQIPWLALSGLLRRR